MFEPNKNGFGIHAIEQFQNGYGVSVIKSQYSYGGEKGLYELAVLKMNGEMTYNTPITDDVAGWLAPEMVTGLMKQVQEL